MQHLRVVGEQPDAVLLEAPGAKAKQGKGKSKEVVFGEKVLSKTDTVSISLEKKRQNMKG